MKIDAIYFDMDGTIADLYGVENWEPKLRAADASPYLEASPLYDTKVLSDICERLISKGVTIGIITWLAMDASKEYDAEVRKAKKEWIKQHFTCASEIHMLKYGRTKLCAANYKNSILVDDNAKVRNGWHGAGTIDANKNIIKELEKLLDRL